MGQKTKDYLTELENKEVVNRLKNLSNFAKGYLDDFHLVGSIYKERKLIFSQIWMRWQTSLKRFTSL